MVMFAGGSGIAPFRSFWEARRSAGASGRNILFFGVQSRERFLYEEEIRGAVREGILEAHVAFSRDTHGLLYNRNARDLIEETIPPRRIDSTILEQSRDLCKVIASSGTGGLGGYIYICGSATLYESVWQTLQKLWSPMGKGQAILSRAFAEGRVMLDVFTTPRQISTELPVITLSQLARNIGHKEGGRVWVGVHGYVYDITDFLPIHPGGRLIIGTSAGIDASNTFDLMAHTNNGEVQSLLSKYLIGSLSPTPRNLGNELLDLRNAWAIYLRTAVESLTTVLLEVDTIQDKRLWLRNGHLDMCMARKFYQFQSRFIQRTIPGLFGTLYVLRAIRLLIRVGWRRFIFN